MTDLQTYTNAAFGSVRILYEDGKPLFCGADACKALGYKNQSKALNDHCKGVRQGLRVCQGRVRPAAGSAGRNRDRWPQRGGVGPCRHRQI